jgi:hypothetical protein
MTHALSAGGRDAKKVAANGLEMPLLASRQLANNGIWQTLSLRLDTNPRILAAENRTFVSASQRCLAHLGSVVRQGHLHSSDLGWGGCIDLAGFDGTLLEAKDSRFKVYASP